MLTLPKRRSAEETIIRFWCELSIEVEACDEVDRLLGVLALRYPYLYRELVPRLPFLCIHILLGSSSLSSFVLQPSHII